MPNKVLRFLNYKINYFTLNQFNLFQLYSYSGAGSVLETRNRFNKRTGAIGSEVTCGVLVNKVRLFDESLVRSLRLQTTGCCFK